MRTALALVAGFIAGTYFGAWLLDYILRDPSFPSTSTSGGYTYHAVARSPYTRP